LANLTSLDVKDNRIKDLPPEIGYLKNLRELMIDGNKLNALPAEFDEIEDSIERFTYDNNPFSSKLLTFDHDELYDEGDVRRARSLTHSLPHTAQRLTFLP
jgi:Leucine-rich repeat (LRR) protein